MRKTKAIVAALLIVVVGSASTARADEVIVERRSSPVGTIARDTIAGGVLGSAVAGGIILYKMGIDDDDDYDWERTLLWGALIGLGTGLVWGVVDATTAPTYAVSPRTYARDGQSMTLDVRRKDTSRRETFPVMRLRF
jgi:hypothetical protein